MGHAHNLHKALSEEMITELSVKKMDDYFTKAAADTGKAEKEGDEKRKAKRMTGTDKDHLLISGTKLRKMLSEGEDVPVEFSRPEVLAILREYYAGLEEGQKVKIS